MDNVNATVAWFKILERIVKSGKFIKPRNYSTYEILQNTISFDMRYPIIKGPLVAGLRKLSYKFMAAEAYWILTGDDRVCSIAPYCKKIAEFSDDGETFFGAYGPEFCGQCNYIIDKLIEDKNTRQATITLWRKNPPKTKDVPCTIAMSFMIRNNKLNCHVFMRSSDAWLGVPYDFFNFSLMAAYVVSMYNGVSESDNKLEIGSLYWTAASSHLYDHNFEDAKNIVNRYKDELIKNTMYNELLACNNESEFLNILRGLDTARNENNINSIELAISGSLRH